MPGRVVHGCAVIRHHNGRDLLGLQPTRYRRNT